MATNTAFYLGLENSKPFFCRSCGKWYKRVSNVSCLVNHPDGHCHYSDELAEEPFYAKDSMEVLRIANGIE